MQISKLFWLIVIVSIAAFSCQPDASFRASSAKQRLSSEAEALPEATQVLVIEPQGSVIKQGERATLKAFLTAQAKDHVDVSEKVAWSIGDASVVSDEGQPRGQYIGKKVGLSAINVTIDGLVANANVTVEAAPKVDPLPEGDFNLKIDPDSVVLAISGSVNLSAVALYAGGESAT